MTVNGDRKRRLLLAAIREFKERNGGNSPTLNELQPAGDYKTRSGVRYQLLKLEELGVITRDKRGRISINGAASGRDGAGE
jgi:hypothetical protein